MYLVVRALARLRLRATASGGAYPRAECAFAPDVEETRAYEPLGLAAAIAAAGDDSDSAAACDAVLRAAAGASTAAAGAAGLTWAAYFESALSRKPYENLQRRIVAVARDFFELSDVGAPPAAPPAEVAPAAAAAARAAAAAAAETELSSERAAAGSSSGGGAVDVEACLVEAEAWGGQGGAPAEDAALLQAEREMWATYEAVCRLQRALAWREGPAGAPVSRRARPPYAARALRPLAPPPAAAAFAKLRPPQTGPCVDDVLPPVPPAERAALALWPPTRRAVRASFALAAVLPELTRAAGRQSLLDAPSAAARLRAVTDALAARRATLAALAAVEGMQSDAVAEAEEDEAA
jgi:hypothetical protein